MATVVGRLAACLPDPKILLPTLMWLCLAILLAFGITVRQHRNNHEFWNPLVAPFDAETLDALVGVVQAGTVAASLSAAAQAFLLGLTTEINDDGNGKGPRRKALEAITVWNITLAVVLGLDQLGMLHDWLPAGQEPLHLGVLLCMACGPFFHVYILLRAVEAREGVQKGETPAVAATKRAAVWAGVVWCIPKVIHRLGPGFGWQIAGTVTLIVARLYMCTCWHPSALVQIKSALSHWSTIWGPILADFLLLFAIDALELCVMWDSAGTGIREPHTRLLMCIAWIVHAVHEPYMVAWASITGDEAKRVAAERVAMRTQLAARDKQLQDQTEAEAARQKFMRYIFHEVRVPFNSIDMGLALLEEEEMGNMSREGRATLSIMTKAALSMRVIINDTLDWSKIQSGAFQVLFGPARISDIIQSTVLNMTPFAASPELQVQLSCEVDDDIPAWVLADKVRLQQVLANFVSNAIKFSSHDGHGKVKVRAFTLAESKQLSEAEIARLGKVWWKEDVQPPSTGARAAIKDMMKRMNSASAVVGAKLAQMASFRTAPGARRGSVDDSSSLFGSVKRLFHARTISAPFVATLSTPLSSPTAASAPTQAQRQQGLTQYSSTASVSITGPLRSSLRTLAQSPLLGFMRRGSNASVPEVTAVAVDNADCASVPAPPEPWQPPYLPSLRVPDIPGATQAQLNSEGFTVDGQGGCVLVLEVQDNGDGIAKGDIPTLFQAFKQLDAGLQYKGKGTGLGLAICQEIVALHGGRVGVRSAGRPGEGAAFLVALRLDTLSQNGKTDTNDSDAQGEGQEGGTGYYGSSTQTAKLTRTYSNSSYFNKQLQQQRASPALVLAPTHPHARSQVPSLNMNLSPASAAFSPDAGAGPQGFAVSGPMSPPVRRPSRRLSRRLSRRESQGEGAITSPNGGGVLSRLARRISDGIGSVVAANEASRLHRHASRRSDSPSVRSLSSVRSIGSNKSWGSVKTIGSVRSQGSLRSTVSGVGVGVVSPGHPAVRGSRVYSGMSSTTTPHPALALPGAVPELVQSPSAIGPVVASTGTAGAEKKPRSILKKEGTQRRVSIVEPSGGASGGGQGGGGMPLSPAASGSGVLSPGSAAPTPTPIPTPGITPLPTPVPDAVLGSTGAVAAGSSGQPGARRNSVSNHRVAAVQATMIRRATEAAALTAAAIHDPNSTYLPVVHGHHGTSMSTFMRLEPQYSSGANSSGGNASSSGNSLGLVHTNELPPLPSSSEKAGLPPVAPQTGAGPTGPAQDKGQGQPARQRRLSLRQTNSDYGESVHSFRVTDDTASYASSTLQYSGSTASSAVYTGSLGGVGGPTLHTGAGTGGQAAVSAGGSRRTSTGVAPPHGIPKLETVSELSPVAGTARNSPAATGSGSKDKLSPGYRDSSEGRSSKNGQGLHIRSPSKSGGIAQMQASTHGSPWAESSQARPLPAPVTVTVHATGSSPGESSTRGARAGAADNSASESVGDPQPMGSTLKYTSVSSSSAFDVPPPPQAVREAAVAQSLVHASGPGTSGPTLASASSPFVAAIVSPGGSVGNQFHALSPLTTGRSQTESRTVTAASSPSFAAAEVPPELVLRLLVVDDAADNRKLLARSLRLKLGQALKAGKLGTFVAVEIDEADDGDEAVHAVCSIPTETAMAVGRAGGKLSEAQLAQVVRGPVRGGLGWYHGITMDAEMPRLSGFAATPLIRAAGYQGPIFGCTGNALPEDQKLFRDAGVNRVFCKPVQVPEVVEGFLHAWKKLGTTQ